MIPGLLNTIKGEEQPILSSAPVSRVAGESQRSLKSSCCRAEHVARCQSSQSLLETCCYVVCFQVAGGCLFASVTRFSHLEVRNLGDGDQSAVTYKGLNVWLCHVLIDAPEEDKHALLCAYLNSDKNIDSSM